MTKQHVDNGLGSPLTLQPGDRIGHYEIDRLIGVGGMGNVYLAKDEQLDRKVAIKVLNEKYESNEANVQRFIQEARAASALNHPNILVIHEIGESENTNYIVSEYIEGETLRDVFTGRRSRLLEILDISIQVVSALAAAHRAGIVHRDIKPENIMLRPDGYVKVLDFGLAKLLPKPVIGLEDETIRQNETAKGLILGTVSYMSPEQARGLPVDERTDIFSLGAVIYEAVAGRTPLAGDSNSETFANLINKEPAPLSDVVAAVPDELQRIVSKMLRKDRDDRYQTMKGLLADLKEFRERLTLKEKLSPSANPQSERATEVMRAATGNANYETAEPRQTSRRRLFSAGPARLYMAVVALLLGVTALAWYWRLPSDVLRPEIRSLAVLPLENLSGDPSQEYFADGMTEALISNLSQIKAVKVISRTSIMRYKGSRDSLPEIARQLGVDAIIEGSVQRSGGRVRVSAQLIHAASDAHLWAREYERDLSDLLRLESDVAQAIASEIKAKLTESEQRRLAQSRTLDPRASEEYLLGQYHLQKLNEHDLALAVDHFNRAIEIEPEYPEAYAGLSRAWFERGIWGKVTYIQAQDPARKAANKALELDPNLSIAHTAIAFLNVNYDWDWNGAEAHIKRAIELDPNSSDAYLAYSWFLLIFGRFEEMKQNMAMAEQLDPVSSRIQSDFGRMLYRARIFDEAERHLKRAIELEPNSSSVYGRLADVYMLVGRFDEALQAETKAHDISTGPSYELRRACIYARMGQRDKALEEWKNASVKHAGDIARLYTEFGDFDKAFEELNRGLDMHEAVLPHVRVDPGFDKLHSDPRWAKFLARMNLPPS